MILDFSTFSAEVLGRLGVDHPDVLTPDEDLCADVALDSFQVVELIVTTEVLAGRSASMVVPTLRTLGDAYQYYRELLTSPT